MRDLFLTSACAASVCVAIMAVSAGADDWPQWMGTNRDDVYRETGIIDSIPETGLPVKWRVPVSGGYSGPAVAAGKVYLFDYNRKTGEIANNPGSRNELTGSERLQCIDAKTGNVDWTYQYDCPYSLSYAIGPRATPTVDGDQVYLLGAMGNLTCVSAKDGSVIWAKDLKLDYGASVPIWGFCGHPLVADDTLFCLVGGEGSIAVAFDKHTGEEKWRALSAKEQGYCPPTMIQAGGVTQLIIWHPEAINGLNPSTGDVYWSLPLQPDYGMSIMAPQQSGDLLYATGIGNIGALIRLASDEPTAEIVRRGNVQTDIYAANVTPLIVDGTVYGTGCRKGQLLGVDLLSGERLWETFEATTGDRKAGHASAFITKIGEDPNGSRFFLFNEQGHLILANLTRERYEELGRFQVLEPTNEAFGRPVVWSHPAYAQRCLFARNDKELVCVSLAKSAE